MILEVWGRLLTTVSHTHVKLISSPYPYYADFLSRETSRRDFPHSRQTRLALGVISPQNGHIICTRTSWTRGLSVPSALARDCHADASRRPRDGRNLSIDSPLPSPRLIAQSSTTRQWQSVVPNSVQDCSHYPPASINDRPAVHPRRSGTEQFRPAIRLGCAHDGS